MSDLRTTETPGRQLLKAWLDAEPGRNPTKLAGVLGLSQPAVRAWVIGASRPEHPFREALHVLCGIPVEAWELEQERDMRLRAIRFAETALAESEKSEEETAASARESSECGAAEDSSQPAAE